MGILSWLVVGFVAGGLARIATGSEKRGCLGTIVVGVVGALIGGFLFNLVFVDKDRFTHFGLGSVLVAFVGACLLLLLLQAIGGGRSRRVQRR